jgi:hypothetical protein
VGNKTEAEWHTDPVLIERILREQEAAAKKDREGSGNIGWFVHVYPGAARLAWDGRIHSGPMWTECVEIDVTGWIMKQLDKLDANQRRDLQALCPETVQVKPRVDLVSWQPGPDRQDNARAAAEGVLGRVVAKAAVAVNFLHDVQGRVRSLVPLSLQVPGRVLDHDRRGK